MYIALGILAVIVVSLLLLNPFVTRRTVTKTVDPPIYRLNSPLEATGVLLVGTAKVDGDMTLEEKELLLKMLQEEVGLPQDEAISLLRSSVELFGDGVAVLEDLGDVLAPVIGKFTEEQKESLLSMMERVARPAGAPQASKLELVAATRTRFDIHSANRASPWGAQS